MVSCHLLDTFRTETDIGLPQTASISVIDAHKER